MVVKPKERHKLIDLGIDGSVTLKWMLKSRMGERRLGCSGSGWGQVAGCFEDGNEHSEYFLTEKLFSSYD